MRPLNVPFAFILLAFFATGFAHATPGTLTYQGRIKNTQGSPLEYNGVIFEFSITNPQGTCVMYRETSPALDMRNSAGVFDVPIGAGTKIFPAIPAFKLLDVFENSGSFNCEGGGSYAPVADDKRLLRVQFYDGVGWRLITPDADIRSVPFAAQAKVAQSAHKLGTLLPGDVLEKASLPLCPAGQYLRHVAPAGTFLCETAVISGANVTGNIPGTAAGFSGSLAGDVTGAQSATSVDRIKGTPVLNSGLAAGKVLKYDGTNWAPADDNSGTANAITAMTGDVSSAGNPTATVTLNSNAVTTAKIQDGAVNSAKIADGSIVNDDISAGAAISDSKLATITTSGKVSGDAITTGTIGGSTAINTSGLIRTSGGLRLYSGANYVELKAPTLVQNSSYELPTADGGNGQVLTTDGTGKLSWTTIVNSGGTVTGVTANAPLASTGGTAPVISLNDSGVGAGTYSKVTVNSKGLVTGGSNLTAAELPNLAGDVTSTAGLSNTKVEKIQGVSVASTTPVVGQVLMHDSSKWNVQYFGFGQLRSTVTGNPQMPATCATSNKTLNWSAITDTFTCVDIAIANTQVSGLGTASTKNFGAAAGNLVELDGSGKIPASLLPASAFADDLGNHTATTHLNLATFNITGAGKVFLSDGAANSPSLTFTGNPLTGFFNSSGALGLSTSGSERMRIDTSGNLGLGTTAPTSVLHVERTQDADTTVQVRNTHDTGTAAGARFIASNEKSGIWFGISGTSNTNTGLGSPGDAYIYNAAGTATGKNLNVINNQTGNIHFFAGSTATGTPRMTITNTGLVGINTAAPLQKLHVENGNMVITGTAPAYQLKENDTTDQNWQMGINNGNLRFATQNDALNSSSDKVVISQTGNVGIGAAAPTAKLEVAGTIHSTSGGIKFPDGSVQTTAASGAATWTSLGLTSLGAVSMTTTTEQSFTLPVAAQTASQILVYLRCHSGNASTTGADDIRIYTKEGAATYDHYLLMFPYAGQGAVGYNSDSFWLPKTSDNKIYLAHSMAPGATNSGCNFYITGYK
ncbi:hypothetical protein Bb109J_c1985 [Bdellovibrio bacteriovorus]|uniref:beta strand repeat-containing protein n=1 Tax=Bdellovibrio bacteriovorus TaxID=959 RepID=UPI00045C093F|nr:hypothetical protein [Bdellovibrio bacteriovorus]AHZ84675.1 cell wall anchor protein [Bdellovibrio bacteriovorus]BEV68565.1 hypothetical protein Bb109J_c1985 [Bdellovibrio bacteriovorus]